MAWIKIDRGLVAHKKIARLSARMKWSRFQSIGFMTAFWIWAAENCDDGQLGDIEDMEIAFAVSMDGPADGILEALVAAGFVDKEPLRIHDWFNHQHEYLRSKYRREPGKLARIHALYPTCTGTTPVQDHDSTAPEKRREEEKREEDKTLLCPHQEIVALYHEILPELTKVREWTEKRQALLRSRWNENPERQNLEWWKSFFQQVKASDFLCGRKTEWKADLEWMVRPTNFIKVVEGKYVNNGGSQQQPQRRDAVHPLSHEVVSKKNFKEGAPANWFDPPPRKEPAKFEEEFTGGEDGK